MMTPEQQEIETLNEMWGLLKKREATFDQGIRCAVRLIVSCAIKSESPSEAFGYASRLLARAEARSTQKPNKS